MNKVIPMKKTLRKRVVQTVVPGTHFKLPTQEHTEIQLVDTDTQLLLNLAEPNDFRNALSLLKAKFVKDTQALSDVCDLEVEVKVYFTFKTKE